ncbi:hypothetical protein SSTU70S_04934 [Stutzerimonas stutzeri]
MRCAIGIGCRAYLEHYYATNEEASGAIAYELLARDNAVMGSPMQVSRDTFLEHEMGAALARRHSGWACDARR